MSTQTVHATGDSTPNQWLASSVSVASDTQTNDGNTTYAYRQNSDGAHHLTFTAFAITSSSINYLRYGGYFAESSGGSLFITPGIVVNGTTYQGSASTINSTSYSLVEYDWLTNPDTASAWTEADIEGTGSNPLQTLRLRNTGTGTGEESRCTEVYLTVDYNTAGTTINATTASLTTSVLAGSVSIGNTIAATTAALTKTTYAASISLTYPPIDINATLAQLQLTTYQADITPLAKFGGGSSLSEEEFRKLEKEQLRRQELRRKKMIAMDDEELITIIFH